MQIRNATKQDIPALQKLYRTIGQKPEEYFESCFERGLTVLLATSKEEVVGYTLLNFEPKYNLYKKLHIPEIQDLNVVPDMRRQGAATALIEHCEALAKDKGHDQIGISVGLTPSYGAAQRLYCKLGYRPDGLGVTYDRQPVRHGEMRPVDDDLCLMMVKSLV